MDTSQRMGTNLCPSSGAAQCPTCTAVRLCQTIPWAEDHLGAFWGSAVCSLEYTAGLAVAERPVALLNLFI